VAGLSLKNSVGIINAREFGVGGGESHQRPDRLPVELLPLARAVIAISLAIRVGGHHQTLLSNILKFSKRFGYERGFAVYLTTDNWFWMTDFG